MKKKLIISLIAVIIVLGVAFAIGALVKEKDTLQDMIIRIESAIKEVLGDDVKKQTETVVAGTLKYADKEGNEITELRIAKIGTHNVIVNGESKFYAHGESVTVTANEPAEGKVFKGWQDASGKIVSTEKSYTFTVNGETTLTAVYEDKSSGGGEITPPAKKDGLSGGQIAGIVIGTVLLAGIGGFAIFWFAVKKKKFADLIALFKKK